MVDGMTAERTFECVLCGRVGPERDVRVGLLRYKDRGAGTYFGTDPRCRDHEACRARVIEAGKEWPLISEPRDGQG